MIAELIRKSNEGSAKGNLGAVRSALSNYSADMEGLYPAALLSPAVNKKYIPDVPTAKAPNYHSDSVSIVQAPRLRRLPTPGAGAT